MFRHVVLDLLLHEGIYSQTNFSHTIFTTEKKETKRGEWGNVWNQQNISLTLFENEQLKFVQLGLQVLILIT